MKLSTFEFTEEDLRSNQRGFISNGQKEMINNMAKGIRSSQKGTAKVAIVFPFIGLCMILALSLSNESARVALLSDPMNLLILASLVPLIIGIFTLGIFLAYRRADRLLNADLKKVEGPVRLDETHSSKVGSTYYVIIGKTKFAFPEDVSTIFRAGEKYKIYYCEIPALKLILSFEKSNGPEENMKW